MSFDIPDCFPPRLRAKIEVARQHLVERDAQLIEHCQPESRHRIEVVQLPPWNDARRAMPNEYARSAIFTVRNKKVPRRSFTNQAIFVVGDGEITYTGIELRAYDDELVWLEILNLAKEYTLGKWIEFTPYQICKALDWATNGFHYKKVHECLLRLKSSAVALHNKQIGQGKAISFIEAYEWQDAALNRLPRCRIMIHPTMQTLFAGNKFTEVEWKAYRKLSPVARRLYDYSASHKRPYALRLDTIRNMCGSDCTSREGNRWAQIINDALAEMGSSGLLACGYIHRSLVHFKRK